MRRGRGAAWSSTLDGGIERGSERTRGVEKQQGGKGGEGMGEGREERREAGEICGNISRSF